MYRLSITAGAIVSVMMSSAALAQSSPCASLAVGKPPYAEMPYQPAPATAVPPSPMNEAAGSRQTPPPPPSVAADLPISKEPNKGSAILDLKPLPCSTGQNN